MRMMMRKSIQTVIEMVLAASLLTGCVVVEQLLKTPRKIPNSVTASMTRTISSTITQTWTPTITLTPSVTPTPTEAPEAKLIEWDSVEININGRPVEFVMGVEDNSNVLSVWSQWGVHGLSINREMKGDNGERLGKMIEAALWQASSNGGSINSFQKFLKGSDQFPIILVKPDGKGGFQDKSIKLNDIKRFEWRFINSNDLRLYFLNAQISPKVGYKMRDDGTLIVYSAPTGSGVMDVLVGPEFKGFAKDQVAYLMGDQLGDLLWEVIEIGYTTSLHSSNNPESDSAKASSDTFYSKLVMAQDACNYASSSKLPDRSSYTFAISYFRDYGLWKAVVK
jgi:hypothetical protein